MMRMRLGHNMQARILVVDDDPASARALHAILRITDTRLPQPAAIVMRPLKQRTLSRFAALRCLLGFDDRD